MSASIVPLASSSSSDAATSSRTSRTVYRSTSTGLLATGPHGMQPPGMRPIGTGVYARIGTEGATGADVENGAVSPSSDDRPLLGELTKYKYSRLNLTTNQHGEYERHSIVKNQRQVSMFWQEKLGLLLMFIQFHALIWLQCYPFYPKEYVTKQRKPARRWCLIVVLTRVCFRSVLFRSWREYWRWTLVFILDIHNVIKDSGGSDSASDSTVHTVFVLLLPIVAYALYEFASRAIYSDRIAGSIHEDKHRVSYLTFQKWSLLLAEQLYIPTILVWFRMWTCDSYDSVTYINRNWQCWGAEHGITIVVITIISGFFMVAMPYVIWNRMKRIIVFHDAQTHERVCHPGRESAAPACSSF
jgi:hypothetical protein